MSDPVEDRSNRAKLYSRSRSAPENLTWAPLGSPVGSARRTLVRSTSSLRLAIDGAPIHDTLGTLSGVYRRRRTCGARKGPASAACPTGGRMDFDLANRVVRPVPRRATLDAHRRSCGTGAAPERCREPRTRRRRPRGTAHPDGRGTAYPIQSERCGRSGEDGQLTKAGASCLRIEERRGRPCGIGSCRIKGRPTRCRESSCG